MLGLDLYAGITSFLLFLLHFFSIHKGLWVVSEDSVLWNQYNQKTMQELFESLNKQTDRAKLMFSEQVRTIASYFIICKMQLWKHYKKDVDEVKLWWNGKLKYLQSVCIQLRSVALGHGHTDQEPKDNWHHGIKTF